MGKAQLFIFWRNSDISSLMFLDAHNKWFHLGMQTVWIFPNWPLYQSPVKSKYGTLQWLFHTTYSAPTPILIKIVWDMIQDERFSLLRFHLRCGAINRHLTHE